MKNLKISISREFNCTGDCQFCIKNDYLGDVYDKPETGEKLKHPYFYCNGTIYKIIYDGMRINQQEKISSFHHSCFIFELF